ncbi:DnaJ C-terminal domain-containing protein [Roseospirillum parvum]|uniref:DnaJ-class molecular chaperone with C-terminal Zn finger domain n=1 Tax=Roseospirillum parvum TaxID=83401 RepID=A0A1G8DKS7_9PROT|nr:J domain-containing protein [Roseospirillum parvum]SDH58228.1 DnaJ-class molecular chaperone with C-terminal Zn finger domain [Roseospirillum parvum]
MPRDPYQVLGVAKSASQDEIKKAYRRLARERHPDANTSDPKAAERFKELSTAYSVIGKPEQRRRFDRGEIDAVGNERPQGFGGGGARRGGGGFSWRPGTSGAGTSGFGFEDLADDDIFADLFRRAGSGQQRRAAPQRGADVRATLTTDFLTAALGGSERVQLATGKHLSVSIPPACEDGRTLRLKGQGHPGGHGGPPGDALVEIKVKPHPILRRDGLDILADVPISLREAVLGARITVPTVHGKVSLTIPAGSNSGNTLRLRGKGLPGKGTAGTNGNGDQLVTLKITLPDPHDDRLKSFVETWTPKGEGSLRPE